MQISASSAPQLLTGPDPLGRGPPDFSRSAGRAPDAAGAQAPFDLLLQMLGQSLPQGLPPGETLPVCGSDLAADAFVPDADTDAAPSPLDPTIAALLGLPTAIPAATAGGAQSAAGSPAQSALADALRLALAGAQGTQAAAPPLTSAADTSTAAAADLAGAAGTDASVAAPTPTPAESAARTATPAELDALAALDPAARASAPPPAEWSAGRPRAPDDGRSRASGVTPASRALALATELARVDAAHQTRGEAALPRALDSQLPAAAADAPVLLATLRLDEPVAGNATAPVASADSGSLLAPLAPHASTGTSASTAATAPAQPPPTSGAPVDTHSARWHDALASRIQWLVDHKIGEAQIKLNPPELGALDVKISMQEDKTFVQMTAHTSAARDELSQSLPRLRELMSAGGLDLGGATVSGGRDDRSGYQAATRPAMRSLAFAADADHIPADLPRLRLSSAARIDIFA